MNTQLVTCHCYWWKISCLNVRLLYVAQKFNHMKNRVYCITNWNLLCCYDNRCGYDLCMRHKVVLPWCLVSDQRDWYRHGSWCWHTSKVSQDCWQWQVPSIAMVTESLYNHNSLVRELALTGRKFDAKEALEMGFVRWSNCIISTVVMVTSLC